MNILVDRVWQTDEIHKKKTFGQSFPLLLIVSLCLLMIAGFSNDVFAQAEVTAWGNLRGIRVDGQLMKFETNLRVVGKNWSNILQTAKERQNPTYSRIGNKRTIKTKLGSLNISETVTDEGTGLASINVKYTSDADTNIAGAYFCITLPGSNYIGGSAHLIKPESSKSKIELTPIRTSGKNEYVHTKAAGIEFDSPNRQLKVTFGEPTDVLVKDASINGNNNIEVYLAIIRGNAVKGRMASRTFTLKASGRIDKSPVTLTLNTSEPGRTFAGIGGNFRLQNPKLDPEVINYNLNHLRVAWARVELPWSAWQPKENADPIKAAEDGNLNPHVKASMEMAQKLNKMGIPLILSAWFPPQWAVRGKLHYRPVNGVWGNELNPEKMNEIYKSITGYIQYLKNHYGVEIKMFSFNESDLGINVRQTPEQHDQLIKGLGAYFEAHGLKTKLLLGDTSDANPFYFIKPAMSEPAARPYMGAVDFHSWRGWADSTLEKWAHAATKLHLPLIVGEGSIDAAAWRYPQIFLEPTYAREEINLYVKILSICEPESILQWQLTSDYSDMAGGGLWGNDSTPLHPTQRFWNLKQLGSTPKDLHFMPITSNRTDVTCAAMGNNAKGMYAIHLVNNGTTRKVILTGLPDNVHSLQIYITDSEDHMKRGKTVMVKSGRATFELKSESFTSLVNAKI